MPNVSRYGECEYDDVLCTGQEPHLVQSCNQDIGPYTHILRQRI